MALIANGQAVNASNTSLNKIAAHHLMMDNVVLNGNELKSGNGQIKIESLLNQVSIENDESFACQTEPQLKNNDINHSEDKAKSSFQLQTRPFHLQQPQQLNENWPNPPN
jgi:hypothetical protein